MSAWVGHADTCKTAETYKKSSLWDVRRWAHAGCIPAIRIDIPVKGTLRRRGNFVNWRLQQHTDIKESVATPGCCLQQHTLTHESVHICAYTAHVHHTPSLLRLCAPSCPVQSNLESLDLSKSLLQRSAPGIVVVTLWVCVCKSECV